MTKRRCDTGNIPLALLLTGFVASLVVLEIVPRLHPWVGFPIAAALFALARSRIPHWRGILCPPAALIPRHLLDPIRRNTDTSAMVHLASTNLSAAQPVSAGAARALIMMISEAHPPAKPAVSWRRVFGGPLEVAYVWPIGLEP